MRYATYVDELDCAPRDAYFLKLAEKRTKKKRSLLKDVALVGGGTALGAGLGYGSAALFNKRYGHTMAGMSPQKRLNLAVPAAAGVGGLLALTHVLRQRADSRQNGDQ
ncbi:MAG: hypothetical protein VXZ72_00340 [Chlamydiota bacterium]|nr:hypothetical protein [Chlamydiota bacterium]